MDSGGSLLDKIEETKGKYREITWGSFGLNTAYDGISYAGIDYAGIGYDGIVFLSTIWYVVLKMTIT